MTRVYFDSQDRTFREGLGIWSMPFVPPVPKSQLYGYQEEPDGGWSYLRDDGSRTTSETAVIANPVDESGDYIVNEARIQKLIPDRIGDPHFDAVIAMSDAVDYGLRLAGTMGEWKNWKNPWKSNLNKKLDNAKDLWRVGVIEKMPKKINKNIKDPEARLQTLINASNLSTQQRKELDELLLDKKTADSEKAKLQKQFDKIKDRMAVSFDSFNSMVQWFDAIYYDFRGIARPEPSWFEKFMTKVSIAFAVAVGTLITGGLAAGAAGALGITGVTAPTVGAALGTGALSTLKIPTDLSELTELAAEKATSKVSDAIATAPQILTDAATGAANAAYQDALRPPAMQMPSVGVGSAQEQPQALVAGLGTIAKNPINTGQLLGLIGALALVTVLLARKG